MCLWHEPPIFLRWKEITLMNVFFLNTFLSNFIIFLYRNSLINFFIDNEDQLLLVHAIAIPFSYILWNKTTQYIHKLENNNRKTNRNCPYLRNFTRILQILIKESPLQTRAISSLNIYNLFQFSVILYLIFISCLRVCFCLTLSPFCAPPVTSFMAVFQSKGP